MSMIQHMCVYIHVCIYTSHTYAYWLLHICIHDTHTYTHVYIYIHTHDICVYTYIQMGKPHHFGSTPPRAQQTRKVLNPVINPSDLLSYFFNLFGDSSYDMCIYYIYMCVSTPNLVSSSGLVKIILHFSGWTVIVAKVVPHFVWW